MTQFQKYRTCPSVSGHGGFCGSVCITSAHTAQCLYPGVALRFCCRLSYTPGLLLVQERNHSRAAPEHLIVFHTLSKAAMSLYCLSLAHLPSYGGRVPVDLSLAHPPHPASPSTGPGTTGHGGNNHDGQTLNFNNRLRIIRWLYATQGKSGS